MKYFQDSFTSASNRTGIFLVSLLWATASLADNFTTSVYQPYTQPPLTWNEAIWEPGPAVPTAGNTYEVLNGGLIRNPPAAGVQTFPGDSLTLDLGASIKAKGFSNTVLNFPGANGSPGLILNGGAVIAADDQTFTITGRVSVVSDSIIDFSSSARSFTITAEIDGDGSLTLINGGNSNPLDIESQDNPYSGNWLIAEGYLKGTGNGSLGTGSITISNGAALEVDYDIASPGTLVLLGDNSVMILHQDCQFSGLTVDGIPLAPGTYSYAQLVTQFPGNFAAGGSGSITVVPLIPASPDSTGADDKAQTDTSSASSEEGAGDVGDSLTTGSGTGGSDTIPNLIAAGAVGTVVPVAPSGVMVSGDSTSQITIRWNASSDDGGPWIAGYKVYRNGALVATIAATGYADNGLNPSTEYCYTIVAYDVAGNNSSASAQACATTPAPDTIPPSVPNGVIASAVSTNGIALQWNASTDIGGSGVSGYRVFRNGMLCYVTNATSFIDSGLTPDMQYCYVVDAFDFSWNRSSLSAQACATTLPSPDADPIAPSDLTATVVAATYVTLTWKDNSNDELGFQIERAPSPGGPWTVVGTVTANTTVFTDLGLAPSTTYYYRASAFN